jgi:RanBP1 domain
VTTGEEEEKWVGLGYNVLFSERSFLYRFVADTKEWKEKGRGEMKILENKMTGRTKLLMRCEQFLKICWFILVITASLALKPLQTSDRTWTWTAQYFSEGELTQETFALNFQKLEQAQKLRRSSKKPKRRRSSRKCPNLKLKPPKLNRYSTDSSLKKKILRVWRMFHPQSG